MTTHADPLRYGDRLCRECNARRAAVRTADADGICAECNAADLDELVESIEQGEAA